MYSSRSLYGRGIPFPDKMIGDLTDHWTDGMQKSSFCIFIYLTRYTVSWSGLVWWSLSFSFLVCAAVVYVWGCLGQMPTYLLKGKLLQTLSLGLWKDEWTTDAFFIIVIVTIIIIPLFRIICYAIAIKGDAHLDNKEERKK